MSGHSHWAGIKHRKGINDAKRGKIFTKHAKMITIMARDGGGNPDVNFQLRLAIDRARLDNMPKENIDRAIKKGTGELKDGNEIAEIIYEGMGLGGVMMLIKTATDNRNRTVSEIKNIFTKAGGKLGEVGSVSWNFKKVGSINISVQDENDLDKIEEKAIDAGAEDTIYADNILTIYTLPENLKTVQENLEKPGLKIEAVGMIFIPLQKTVLSESDRLDYEKLLETLDDQDDTQEIFDNL
ncbi:MAG TPA: YebC/PmpR family DNA-binding transcriptional regulator [Candidatus Moranbacteria bacterium]|nr:YebC/PmpR family DNA-binding transcriptional regulator [Candidatus Moranbacteria bacterium]HAT75073.1 YebC/PmpR family DNA-binding transcriptional regulator [Candidatus Moranbacteria bacterium]